MGTKDHKLELGSYKDNFYKETLDPQLIGMAGWDFTGGCRNICDKDFLADPNFFLGGWVGSHRFI